MKLGLLTNFKGLPTMQRGRRAAVSRLRSPRHSTIAEAENSPVREYPVQRTVCEDACKSGFFMDELIGGNDARMPEGRAGVCCAGGLVRLPHLHKTGDKFLGPMFLWITCGTFFRRLRPIKCSTQVPNLSPHRFGFTYPQQTLPPIARRPEYRTP